MLKVQWRRTQGLTLVELMVGSAITLIVGAVVTGILLNTQKSFRHTNDRIQARQDASLILRTIDRELRQASKSSSDLESVETADRNQLLFYADNDNNDRPERIDYRLNNSSIIKTVTQASNAAPPWLFNGAQTTETLTTNSTNDANNPLFSYFYWNRTVDPPVLTQLTTLPLSGADRARIKLVRINISIRLQNSVVPDNFISEVYLRNKNEAN